MLCTGFILVFMLIRVYYIAVRIFIDCILVIFTVLVIRSKIEISEVRVVFKHGRNLPVSLQIQLYIVYIPGLENFHGGISGGGIRRDVLIVYGDIIHSGSRMYSYAHFMIRSYQGITDVCHRC